MNLRGRLLRWLVKSTGTDSLRIFLELYGGYGSNAGVSVTWLKALQTSVGTACVRSIAQGASALPLKLYRKKAGGGKEEALDHPLWPLITLGPNPSMTSIEWIETLLVHAVLIGNGYNWLNRNGAGVIREIWPVTPDRMTVEQLADWSLRFKIRTKGGLDRVLPRDELVHLHGISWSGHQGLETVKLAREAFGLSLAAEEHGARFFGQGAIAPGFFALGKGTNGDLIKRLEAQWDESHAGADRWHKPGFLPEGSTWSAMGHDNEKSQFTETRRHQVEEICRFFGVFPVVVGFADKTATFASVEQFFLAHLQHTLMPWIRRVETVLRRDLLSPEEQRDHYFKFSLQAFLRGDMKARAEFYAKLFSIASINPNEIRDHEEMEPYEGGERFFWPVNMSPTDEPPPDDPPPDDTPKPKEPEGES